MSVHLFTVTMESVTALPEDRFVNTWYFEGSGSDPGNVGDMLYDFYNALYGPGPQSIANLMSDEVLDGDFVINGYDLADTPPRAPMYTSSRTMIGLSSGEGLPQEVALCMSYQASPVSGTAQARRRGRVYLPAMIEAANTNGRPTSQLVTTVARSASELLQASNASVSWEWQQYSRTTGLGNLVVGGWVDNAWDTQRRRGWKATSRTTFDGSTP